MEKLKTLMLPGLKTYIMEWVRGPACVTGLNFGLLQDLRHIINGLLLASNRASHLISLTLMTRVRGCRSSGLRGLVAPNLPRHATTTYPLAFKESPSRYFIGAYFVAKICK